MHVKYFLISALLAAVVFTCLPVGRVLAQNQDIQALILQIKAQIAQLQAQLQNLLLQQQNNQTWCHTFNANIGIGLKTGNSEISPLIIALQKEGIIAKAATFDGYDQNLVSNVAAFQEKYASEILTPTNLRRGTGFVGVATRAKLNSLYGCKTFCTQESKQCPDGSYVGRTGFNCEFANCPQNQCASDKSCPQLGLACSITYCPTNKCINGKCIIINTAPTCAPNWQAGSWSVCLNSQQTRTVTDLNNCGVDANKPTAAQACACPTINCFWDQCPGKHLPDANGCVNCSTACSQ